jgi:hypothetical protein
MHKVRPVTMSIDSYTITPLEKVTVFTLMNEGSTNALFSFGDVRMKLRPEQTVSFEAGANTVFTEGTQLYVDFIKEQGETNYVILLYNQLTKESQIFADATSK